MEKKFSVGNQVIWTSQAGSYEATKMGKIIERVPVGSRPNIRGCGDARNHVSYVVAVHTTKKGRKTINHREPKLYWPRVSALKAV